MAYQTDYILRLIEDMAEFLRKAVHYAETGEIEQIVSEDGVIDEIAFFEYRLNKLFYQGEFCKAEDLLFRKLEGQDGPRYFNTALQFYQRLSATDPKQFEQDGYSEERIAAGVQRLRALYPKVEMNLEDK